MTDTHAIMRSIGADAERAACIREHVAIVRRLCKTCGSGGPPLTLLPGERECPACGPTRRAIERSGK